MSWFYKDRGSVLQRVLGRRYTRFAGKRGCLVRGLTVTQGMLARQG